MMTAEGLAAFDVAMFTLKQVDFSYRPLSLDEPTHNSQIYSLINQLDQSMNFIADTDFKPTKALLKSVMFVYNVNSFDGESDDDDVLSTSSSSSDENDSLELTRAIRTGFTGIIDFEKNEMIIYPPSHASYLHKDSIINLMDIAESISCSTMYICMEKNHIEMKEFARGFLYAGFQLVQPNVKKLNSNEWVLFGAQL